MRELVTDGFGIVAEEEVRSGESGIIPGFTLEGREAGEFAVFDGISFNKDDVAGFGLDEEEVIDAEELAAAEAAIFPNAFAGGDLDAGQEAIVDSINVIILDGDIGELSFHAAVLPEDFDQPVRVGGFEADFEQGASDPVAGGDENEIGTDGNRLGSFGPFVGCPGKTPEDGAGFGMMSGETGGVDAEDLALASESGEDRGGVGGIVIAGAPGGFAGIFFVG